MFETFDGCARKHGMTVLRDVKLPESILQHPYFASTPKSEFPIGVHAMIDGADVYVVERRFHGASPGEAGAANAALPVVGVLISLASRSLPLGIVRLPDDSTDEYTIRPKGPIARLFDRGEGVVGDRRYTLRSSSTRAVTIPALIRDALRRERVRLEIVRHGRHIVVLRADEVGSRHAWFWKLDALAIVAFAVAQSSRTAAKAS